MEPQSDIRPAAEDSPNSSQYKKNGRMRKHATVQRWWRGDLNPRPAGYESANASTEHPVTTRAYALVQSSVAPQVAILTDDNGCVEVMIPDDLSELIRLWPMLDEAIRSALLALARVGSDR